MDYGNFFWMSASLSLSPMRVKPRNVVDPFKVLRGDVDDIIVYDYASGGQPKDFVASGYPALFLISDRVRTLLEPVTGWGTYRVEVWSKNQMRVEGYSGFCVSGRCGPIEDSLGEVVVKPPRVSGGVSYTVLRGLYFVPSSWDGSDVFVPASSNWVIVTRRVKQLLEAAKVRNVQFEPLTAVERSVRSLS